MTAATHISLYTRDLDRSVEFYRRFLGVDPIKQRTDYAKFRVDPPGLNLALNEVPDPPRPGISHLGIEVADSASVFRRREEVERAGLTTRTEEDVDCCHALQDKFWVTDPDGVAWEVFTVKADTDTTETVGACCAPGCCD